jgi:hypothetical protein
MFSKRQFMSSTNPSSIWKVSAKRCRASRQFICIRQKVRPFPVLVSLQDFTFFIRVEMADLRALLYKRAFSATFCRCKEFCFASTTRKPALATLSECPDWRLAVHQKQPN